MSLSRTPSCCSATHTKDDILSCFSSSSWLAFYFCASLLCSALRLVYAYRWFIGIIINCNIKHDAADMQRATRRQEREMKGPFIPGKEVSETETEADAAREPNKNSSKCQMAAANSIFINCKLRRVRGNLTPPRAGLSRLKPLGCRRGSCPFPLSFPWWPPQGLSRVRRIMLIVCTSLRLPRLHPLSRACVLSNWLRKYYLSEAN